MSGPAATLTPDGREALNGIRVRIRQALSRDLRGEAPGVRADVREHLVWDRVYRERAARRRRAAEEEGPPLQSRGELREAR